MIELLIDGYNVIFQCGLTGRSARPDKLEQARFRLLSELATKLGESTCGKTTIVFDAKTRPVKSVPNELVFRKLRVLFAAEYPDADSLIEELIRTHSAPKKLTVVSSDHRIQTAASRRKATWLDSDVWWERIGSLERSAPSAGTDSAVSDRISERISKPAAIEMTDEEREAFVIAFSREDRPVANNDSQETPTLDEQEELGDAPDKPAKDPLKDFDPFPPGYADDLFDE